MFALFNKFYALFWHIGSSLKKRIVLGFLLILITVGCNLTAPLLLKAFLGSMANHQPCIILLGAGLGYGFIWSLSQVSSQMREIIAFPFIQRLVRSIAMQFVVSLHDMPPSFLIKHQTGRIASILQNAREGSEALFSGILLYIFPIFFEISLVCCVLVSSLPASFTFIFVAMIAGYSIFSFWALGKTRHLQSQKLEADEAVGAYFFDTLLNADTIKLFCTQNRTLDHCDHLLNASEKAARRAVSFTESVRIAQGVILGITLLSLSALSIFCFQKNTLAFQDFVLVNAYFLQLASPLNYLSLILKDIKEGWIDLRRGLD